MRSVLLTTTFPPALGGIETLLYETSRRLADPPLVVAPAPAAAADLVVHPVRLSLPSRLVYRPTWAMHPSLHYLTAFWRPAWQAIRAWRPRVLQAGHIHMAPLAWLLARRLHLPFVVYAYGQEVWGGGRRVGLAHLDAILRGRALAAADAVLTPGRFTAGLLHDWHVRGERIVCVPYGAEPQPRIEPPTGSRLLSVARLIPRKGIDSVISALPLLETHVDYHVVGRGPDLRRLQSLAHQVGVADRVHFLGRLDAASLADEYRGCALFVLPARRTAAGELEGYGLVYFEAAAWGRPVIAGRSGGEIDAVVDGQTGLLVSAHSAHAVEELASAIAGLLGDPDRLRRLGLAGYQRVATTHNWRTAAAVIDTTLERVADR